MFIVKINAKGEKTKNYDYTKTAATRIPASPRDLGEQTAGDGTRATPWRWRLSVVCTAPSDLHIPWPGKTTLFDVISSKNVSVLSFCRPRRVKYLIPCVPIHTHTVFGETGNEWMPAANDIHRNPVYRVR